MTYRLTNRRLLKATPILEEAFAFIVNNRAKSLPYDFEMKLRSCWNIGYQELKDVMADMLKYDRYKYLAVLYMETSSCPGVVTEFQSVLRKLHGVKCYSPVTYSEDRKPFWEGFYRYYCTKQ